MLFQLLSKNEGLCPIIDFMNNQIYDVMKPYEIKVEGGPSF